MPDLQVALRLTADARGFVGEVRLADRELDRLTQGAGRGRERFRGYRQATDEVARSTRTAGQSFLAAHRHHLQLLSGFAGVATVIQAGRAVRRYADEYTQLSNSLRLATDTAGEFVMVQESLFRIADEVRAPVAASAQLYQRLALSADELGASHGQLLTAVRAVGQALAIQGTSSAQASGALLQLSQALGGGVVRAEEFNSLIEGAPALLRAVAGHIDGVGGSVARLRQRVTAGEISSREFFDALLASADELDEQYSRTTGTIEQAYTQIDNNLTRLIGRTDELLGASAAVSSGLGTIAEALRDIDPETVADGLELVGFAALALTANIGGRLVASLVGFAVEAARARREALAVQVALGRMEGQSRASALGFLALGRGARAARGALALLGGTGGVLGLAAVAAFELFRNVESGATTLERARTAVDDLTGSIADLTAAQREVRAFELQDLLEGEGGFSGFFEGLFGDGDGLLAQAEQLRAEIGRIDGAIAGLGEMELRVGGDIIAGLRRDRAEAVAALEAVEAAIQRVRTAQEALRRGADAGDDSPAPPPPVPGLSGADLQRIERIRAAAEDRLAQATLTRIELVNRAERELLEELARARAADAEGHAAIEAARVAVVRAAQAERDRIYRRELTEREAAERAAVEAAERARDEIGDALATPFERAVREAERWGDETRAILRRAGASAEDYAAIEEVVQQRIAAARREAAEAAAEASAAVEEANRRAALSSESLLVGARVALADYSSSVATGAEEAAGAVTRAFGSAEDALAEFVARGKIDFKSLVDSIIADLARLAIRTRILGPLAGAFGLPGIGALVGHEGLIVGQGGGRRRQVPAALFAAAPRLHRGGFIGSDEVPAILRRGEGVFTPEQMRALGRGDAPAVTVNFINRSGSPVTARQEPPRFDGQGWIINLVVEDIDTGGPVARAMQRILPGANL